MSAIDMLPKGMAPKIEVVDDCWIWTASRNNKGYGVASNGKGGSMLAHRKAYQAVHGTIPDGHEIDHLCENKPCVNPAHLEAVTPEEHRRRLSHEDLKPVYPTPRPAFTPSPEVIAAVDEFVARIRDYGRRYEAMSASEREAEDVKRHRLHLLTGTRCACVVSERVA